MARPDNSWRQASPTARLVGTVEDSTGSAGATWWAAACRDGRMRSPGDGFTGSSGRNSFRGPRYFNVDPSMVKRFERREYTHVTVPKRLLAIGLHSWS